MFYVHIAVIYYLCETLVYPADYPLHHFPNPNKHPERFRSWILAIGKKLAKGRDTDIYRTKRICGKHFEEKFRNNNSRLNLIAVPTLHLPCSGDVTKLLENAVEVDEHIPELDFAIKSEHQSDDSIGDAHTETALEPDSSEKEMRIRQDIPALPKQYVTSLTYITVPGKEVARQISRALIEHDLAATVEILSEATSVYKSQGKVREDSKIILMAKTRTSRVSDLCEFAAEKFPLTGYQIVSVPIENGNPHYLTWIADTVPPH